MSRRAKESVSKTNAMRILETAGVDFECVTYEVDENDDGSVFRAHRKRISVIALACRIDVVEKLRERIQCGKSRKFVV